MIFRTQQDIEPYQHDLLSLEECCFPEAVWDGKFWRDFFNNNHLTVIFTYFQKQIVGFIAFSCTSGKTELLKIGVKQKFRRKGFAGILIKQMIDLLDKEQTNQIFLEVRENNEAAIALYLSIGFINIGKRDKYYSDPLDNALLFVLSKDNETSL